MERCHFSSASKYVHTATSAAVNFDLCTHLPCTENRPPLFNTEYCFFAGQEHGTHDTPINMPGLMGSIFMVFKTAL